MRKHDIWSHIKAHSESSSIFAFYFISFFSWFSLFSKVFVFVLVVFFLYTFYLYLLILFLLLFLFLFFTLIRESKCMYIFHSYFKITVNKTVYLAYIRNALSRAQHMYCVQRCHSPSFSWFVKFSLKLFCNKTSFFAKKI